MKKYLFLFLILFATPLFAEEIYLVEKPDGSVAVHYYIPGSNDTLEETLKNAGLEDLPTQRITQNDIPDDRKDRKYWKMNFTGKKIGIDTAKKQADEDAKAAKLAKKEAVLSKLKISPDEFKDLIYDIQK